MTVLYGIWYADYSASSVGPAVYSSRDDAEAVCRTSDGLLVEFEVDPPLDEKEQKLRRPGGRAYRVGMDAEGKGADAPAYYNSTEHDAAISIRVWDGHAQRFNTQTWAHDEKHAIKIANDHRTQWLASGGPLPSRINEYGWGKLA